MNKYLKKYDNGQVDWSKEGFEMLNGFQSIMEDGLDLTCRKLLSEVLMSRGFREEVPYEEYVISDGEGKAVWVYMDDEALKVVRNRVCYNGPMDYELGSDDFGDLWEMIRKAWNAES